MGSPFGGSTRLLPKVAASCYVLTSNVGGFSMERLSLSLFFLVATLVGVLDFLMTNDTEYVFICLLVAQTLINSVIHSYI